MLDNPLLGAFTHRDVGEHAHGLDEVTALFPVLKDRAHQLAGTLSGGEQQMLAIARGLMSRHRILLLDEPSLGIAPKLVARIYEALSAINRSGLTLLLVEQNVRAALACATRGYVLQAGRVVCEGTSTDPLRWRTYSEGVLGCNLRDPSFNPSSVRWCLPSVLPQE